MSRMWNEPFDGSRVLPAGLLAAVISTAVNLGLRYVGRRWFNVPDDETALSLLVVVIVTVAGVLAACLVIMFLGNTQARPFRIFRRLAVIVFLLSCAGPLLGYAGWLPALDAFSPATTVLLLCMNVVTAAASTFFLTTMPRVRRPYGRF